ncbi:MAG: hypothetical protein JZU50_07985 [Desulfobulbaceae bacterium]|nr:hypothetical protein [Desulfobulbaceae bacterium]
MDWVIGLSFFGNAEQTDNALAGGDLIISGEGWLHLDNTHRLVAAGDTT